MSSPIYQAIKQLSDEKNISVESVVETIEAALAAAYRKDFGEKNQNVRVSFDPETGGFEVFDVKTVVEDMELLGDMEEGSEAPVAVRPLVEASLSALSGDSSRLVTVDEKGEVVPREEGDQPAVSGDGPVPEGMGEGEEPRRFNPKTEVMVSVARETMKPEAAKMFDKMIILDIGGYMIYYGNPVEGIMYF
ncbi:hypothetical protein JW899_03300, partial [Candidatus Uhrbacteria bacterium]|nr:hypothetical protein [Candidatus Uhrbacteria bacterium]